ncbi:GNAT family N-acetyltransferase [Agromyces sp. CFH 90414]|uniref:GNAT family N-acetyltransferase n=1 Tax=Agromyces agglutinans TaxID=2662258 RepID=A0A6I2FH84_9MICO|nr:GNAT family N-acetyltransferase [Agromyces agglutinans]MRG60238.1 GNAT family N-acetyltransferase [Agromyces agglutinans]
MDSSNTVEAVIERPLGPAMAGEVLTLQRAAYATEAQVYRDPFLPALTQPLDELARELEGPGLGLWQGERLIGAVRWTVADDIAHVGRLTVAPDLQGRGIGTRLLRAAERASGASEFELFTGHLSEANIRLYEREGYAVARREPLHDGVDLVFMRKSAHPARASSTAAR